jgi:hypothetical protein
MSETITLRGDASADLPAGYDAPAHGLQESDTDFQEPPDVPSSSADTSVTQSIELSPEDPTVRQQRRVLLRKIGRYRAIFPEEVADCDLEALQHRTNEELETTLADVQFAVETRRSTKQARSLFLAGLAVGEAGGQFVGLQLQGLTNVASQSEELLRNVDEVALKYEAVTQLDPVARLALSVGQLALAVDQANRAKGSGGGAQVAPGSEPAPAGLPTSLPASKPEGGTRADNIAGRAEFSDL